VDTVANWKYSGKIKSKSKKHKFNGKPGGKVTGSTKKKEKRIEHNKKRIDDINENWEEWDDET